MDSDAQKMESNIPAGENYGLPHDSVNEGNDQTVLSIHGAFGSQEDWDLVTPHLTAYHLLIPDLPSHGAAQHLKPFSEDYAADLLATLIATRAHGSKAHIVGWSLGASVAVSLASRHPTVVHFMVITGYGRLPRTRFTPYLPYALWTEQRVENMMPRSLVRWLTDGADLKSADTKLMTIDLNREIFVNGMSGEEWPSPWPAKTLIIAATKRGIMPTDDNADIAKKLGAIGSQFNKDTYAVAHAGMRHPWPRQSPVMFAETVKSFLAGQDLPEAF